MKLTIRKSDVLDDHYLIERAEHDGREWNDRRTFAWVTCSVFCASRRLCGIGGFSADIEGSAQEMLDIAQAIRSRGAERFKSCSVDARNEPVLFGSPRNDNGEHGETTLAEADDLADQIEAML